MSLASKATFAASLTVSVGIIVYIHYKQHSDREQLRGGVLRDLELQQMKKTQNIYMLEQQKHLTSQYETQDDAGGG